MLAHLKFSLSYFITFFPNVTTNPNSSSLFLAFSTTSSLNTFRLLDGAITLISSPFFNLSGIIFFIFYLLFLLISLNYLIIFLISKQCFLTYYLFSLKILIASLTACSGVVTLIHLILFLSSIYVSESFSAHPEKFGTVIIGIPA